MVRKIVTVFSSIAILLTSLLPTAWASNAVIESNSSIKIINENYDGKQVTIKQGEILEVQLNSNASTGYSWNYGIEPDSNVLSEVEHRYTSLTNPAQTKPLIGAGGQECWRFIPSKSGVTKLKLNYIRPWESETPPARTFTVEINADAPSSTITKVVDERYDGQQVTIKKGEILKVQLNSNASTGYSWNYGIEPDSNVLSKVGHRYTLLTNPAQTEPLLGAGGREWWWFAPNKSGVTKLKLNYLQPWESDAPPARTFTVEVKVD
ncbi:hypothetical protein GTO89_08020 [Heliobacterium gestii]|uniref:Proteinase inhibitor I42 chagasin domain-containing protein n=1 Tax=Heliomicrobium gestii TaxID=2699 RepID=A0A845LEC3_HELGE|nr:protease inhibitor I42 family protein [Heliomicrobium gestii]MBM7866225.1 putative secreted protein [Heliomicrobium gestii]MZP42979.1 hypothetical protein [Heliomicrobium gestii]